MLKRVLCAALTSITIAFSVAGPGVMAAPELAPDGSVFDPELYASLYPDVTEVFGTETEALYSHYINSGKAEGRSTCDTSDKTIVLPFKGEAVDAVTPEMVQYYYSRSVFIGDSIMTGYNYYLMKRPESMGANARFLAAKSYSAYHAVVPEDPHHPMYQGVSQPVWQSIAAMPNVDRVFIMFGTNDLVVHSPSQAAMDMAEVITLIRSARPDLEIHLISMTPILADTKQRGALNNYSAQIYNAVIRNYSATAGFGYVDLYDRLTLPNGTLNPDYCSDGYCHHTASAYDQWEALLTSYATLAIQNGNK